MPCYITSTGAFLPGDPIDNRRLPLIIGELKGEGEIRERILRMNGIESRHYALNSSQEETHTVYDLAVEAACRCLGQTENVSYLSAGATYTPLMGPGLASIVHSELAQRGKLIRPVEIASHSGICSSSAQALMGAARAVEQGKHDTALCIGAEQPSAILKSSIIRPTDDRLDFPGDIRRSKWFMSVFLRFMLSDGAGAFLLENQPNRNQPCFKINWTFARSYAHCAPLCMQLDTGTLSLSQDIEILRKYLVPAARDAAVEALEENGDDLGTYKCVLPHLSSFYFKRAVIGALRELSRRSSKPVDYWTNLSTAGNTGAASIFILLSEYIKSAELNHGDKLLLFIPESGQFNFVFISLEAIV